MFGRSASLNDPLHCLDSTETLATLAVLVDSLGVPEDDGSPKHVNFLNPRLCPGSNLSLPKLCDEDQRTA